MTAEGAAPPERRFTVVGAGLAGSLMAVYLARAGYQVDLLERRPDPREAGLEGGRSINLALSTRGIDALAGVGLAEEVLAQAIPMRGRLIHGRDGRTAFQPYSAFADEAINSVSRGGLNLLLLEAAEREPNVTVRFGVRCVGADLEAGRLRVRDPETGRVDQVQAGTIVGADGAFSAIRGSMQRRERQDLQQSYLEHGYKELSIPPAEGGGWRLEKNALHIWPRGTYMMIALPNADGSFTCTLFWPYEGPHGVLALTEPAAVRAFFEREFADAVPLLPDLEGQFLGNPTGSLVTIRTAPWHVEDRAVLIGDACHAVVPFYGQGMNAAFEDCLVLDRCLRSRRGDLEAAFREFEGLRRRDCDVLADLAIANYVEMRDRVASPLFRAKKRLYQGLNRLMPEAFLPLYSMVTFRRIPYAEAVARAERQDRAVIAGAIATVLALAALLALALWAALR